MLKMEVLRFLILRNTTYLRIGIWYGIWWKIKIMMTSFNRDFYSRFLTDCPLPKWTMWQGTLVVRHNSITSFIALSSMLGGRDSKKVAYLFWSPRTVCKRNQNHPCQTLVSNFKKILYLPISKIGTNFIVTIL